MNKARERRKQMLGERLEPVVKTTLRKPYNGTSAKSGMVHFLDADDKIVLALAVKIETRPNGRTVHVIQAIADETIYRSPQIYANPEGF